MVDDDSKNSGSFVGVLTLGSNLKQILEFMASQRVELMASSLPSQFTVDTTVIVGLLPTALADQLRPLIEKAIEEYYATRQ